MAHRNGLETTVQTAKSILTCEKVNHLTNNARSLSETADVQQYAYQKWRPNIEFLVKLAMKYLGHF